MDNLSVHRSRDVKERLEELSMPAIFNAAYSCQNNPIEHVFSVVKHFFKKARLECIQLGKKEDMVKAIRESFEKVNVSEVRNMIIRSNYCLR
jgi:transposase